MHKIMQFQKVYQYDRERAQSSSEPFSKLLEDFIKWKTAKLAKGETVEKEINILAHSAGCRLLTYSVHETIKELDSIINKFAKNIFLVAPEMDYDVMQSKGPGHSLASVTDNLYLYFALNDIALTISMLGKEFDSADETEKEIILEFVRIIVDYIKLGTSLKTNFKDFTKLILSKRECSKTRSLGFFSPVLNLIGVRPLKMISMLASVIKIKKAKPSLGQVALKGMHKTQLFNPAKVKIPGDAPENLSLINCSGKNSKCDTKLGHIYHRELDIYDENELVPGDIFKDIEAKLLNTAKKERFAILKSS